MSGQAVLHIDSCRGDSMKDSRCRPLEGNVIQTIVSGNTTIHFCDDFIQTEEESIRNILERYEQIGWNIYQSQNK